jgi:Toluene-4-monooxygenase system protein B (TmoB)
VIPLFGFLEGDTLGLLVLAEEEDTMAVLADKLQKAAFVRVAPRPRVRVVVEGVPMDPRMTVATSGLSALDRFDVEGAAR